MIACDVKDTKYGVETYGKLEKLKQSFGLISKSINYPLKFKYWYEEDFTSELVNKYLRDSLSEIGRNDIVVFYYLGRGETESTSNKTPSKLLFRNPKQALNIQSVNLFLKNKGRLAMVIADCYEPFSKSRSLFLEDEPIESKQINEIVDTSELDSLQALKIKKNLSKISESTFTNYIQSKDSLEGIYSRLVKNETNEAVLEQKILLLLKRLAHYPSLGFPEEKRSLQRKFDILPDLSLKYVSNRDFSCVVDSLYKINALLDFTHPLQVYLDTLIKIPLDDSDERPAVTTERFNEYVIRKMFFSNCGNTVSTNNIGASSPGFDYTDSFYKNLSILSNSSDTKSINKLEIDNLLKPQKVNPYFAISNKTCPSATEKEVYYLPKIIYSGKDIEEKFNAFFMTKDLLAKKRYREEILQIFEKNAKIAIKTKGKKQIFQPLIEYLNINSQIKPSKIDIPVQRIVRDKTFGKIKTLLVVEP
ncbi:hypothetical protein EGI22_11255 [Lacihabitans sp. LS3-19]|nr:hypothetical protein [Lacihabitans sp. LS3-19]